MAKGSVSKQVNSRYFRRIKHGDTDVHDLNLLTRKSTRIFLEDLPGLWGGTSDAQERLALFLLYNKPSFSFLSIEAKLSEDGTPAIVFTASEKSGCAPLYSPLNGKMCASINVRGNMNEDISEVLPLIDGDIKVTFSDKLVLPYKLSVKPPLYFECAKYIDQYNKAQKLHWKKFISEERLEHLPASSTQWAKYASKSYNPINAFKYPNKKNLLSENHIEWKELNYVLKFCLDELSASTTPIVSRRSYNDKIEDLRRKVDFKTITKPVSLVTKSSDPVEIKKLKEIGNRIISSTTNEYRAWNIDFSTLFEKYVQYIFSQSAKQIGGHVLSNYSFPISGPKRAWGLSYLEPDILLLKGKHTIVADAKYKMHMLNVMSKNVDELYESFRHDLHQVLAYTSFDKNEKKISLLVYPSNSFHYLFYRIKANPFSSTNNLYLIGIPWGCCIKDDNTSNMSIEEKVKTTVDGITLLVKDAINK